MLKEKENKREIEIYYGQEDDFDITYITRLLTQFWKGGRSSQLLRG